MELLDYKVVLNKSTYAEFTLYIPKFDLEIAKCREFRMNGDKGPKRWFAFPAYWYEGVDNKGWRPIVKFRYKVTEDNLWEAVRKLVDEYLAAHPEVEVKPQSFEAEGEPELPF